MSDKKTVLDTIQTALEGVSGVGKVVQLAEGYTQVEGADLPAIYLNDTILERERIAFPASTLAADIDMEALLSLEIRGRVFDIQNQTAVKADELLDSVETMLITSTAVSAVVKDIYPVSDVGDEGVQDNYSHWVQSWEVTYHYNHANP